MKLTMFNQAGKQPFPFQNPQSYRQISFSNHLIPQSQPTSRLIQPNNSQLKQSITSPKGNIQFSSPKGNMQFLSPKGNIQFLQTNIVQVQQRVQQDNKAYKTGKSQLKLQTNPNQVQQNGEKVAGQRPSSGSGSPKVKLDNLTQPLRKIQMFNQFSVPQFVNPFQNARQSYGQIVPHGIEPSNFQQNPIKINENNLLKTNKNLEQQLKQKDQEIKELKEKLQEKQDVIKKMNEFTELTQLLTQAVELTNEKLT